MRMPRYGEEEWVAALKLFAAPIAEQIKNSKTQIGRPARAIEKQKVPNTDDLAAEIHSRQKLTQHRLRLHKLVKDWRIVADETGLDYSVQTLKAALEDAGKSKQSSLSTDEIMAAITGNWEPLGDWEAQIQGTRMSRGEDEIVRRMKENWGHIDYGKIYDEMKADGYRHLGEREDFREKARGVYDRWKKIEEKFGPIQD
jgi:hypothetical protein